MNAKWKRRLQRSGWILLGVFILMNIVACFHAYNFTHFSNKSIAKTKDRKDMPLGEKLKALFMGINNPRPSNLILPSHPFQTITLQSNTSIECWLIKAEVPKGTFILFHGYGASKSQMLDKADEFLKLGYNTLLVDFMGSGGSGGNQTTIGYKEAEEVKTCFEYIQHRGEKNIYLFGTSMGAAAVLKAVHEYPIAPRGIIVECPFGSMYQTVSARFHSLGVPAFPMSGLLVFWGGVVNGFPAFDHKPAEYAKDIQCPTLLLYGAKDEKVSKEEIYSIYTNLKGRKQLQVYPNAAHENYLRQYRDRWIQDVALFLKK